MFAAQKKTPRMPQKRDARAGARVGKPRLDTQITFSGLFGAKKTHENPVHGRFVGARGV